MLLAMLITAVTVATVPFLVQRALTGAVVVNNLPLLQTSLLMIIVLSVTGAVAFFTSQYLRIKASDQLGIGLYREFFDKLLAQPSSAYAALVENRQIETQVRAIRHITYSTVGAIAGLAQDCLIISVLLVCVSHYNREMLLLLLFIVPLLALAAGAARDSAGASAVKVNAGIRQLTDQLLQAVAHYRLIKLDGGQACESERLSKMSESIFCTGARYAIAKALWSAIGRVLFVLLCCALSYMLALQMMNGEIGLPEAGALVTAALLLLLPLRRLAGLPQRLAHDRIILDDVFAFTNQVSEPSSTVTAKPRMRGKLVFEQLRFSGENGAPSGLVGLTVHPGELIVFKGFDAHKKQALIDLLLRVQSPLQGKVWLDDQPLDDIPLNVLYANIALLPADTFWLDGNIAGNIAYGFKRCAHEAEITAAVRDSHANTFIRNLPGGLQARIGEDGVNLTRMQYQLLAIARAFIKDAPVVIVDQAEIPPTADAGLLDSALVRLAQHRTTLIFSPHIPRLHRIDRIIEDK